MKRKRNEKEQIVIDLLGEKVDLSNFQDTSPRYKVKQKILEKVIFELRHAPNFGAMEKKSLLLKKFASDFPKNKFYAGPVILEDGIQFFDGKEEYLFWPRCQITSVETNSYSNFSGFKQRCKDALEKYDRFEPLPEIKRVGLRYINKIPIAFNAEKAVDLESVARKFSLQITLGEQAIKGLSLDILHLMPPNVLTKTKMQIGQNEKEAFLLWDNDTFIEVKTTFDTALLILPLLHSVAAKLFWDFLSEDTKGEFIDFSFVEVGK